MRRIVRRPRPVFGLLALLLLLLRPGAGGATETVEQEVFRREAEELGALLHKRLEFLALLDAPMDPDRIPPELTNVRKPGKYVFFDLGPDCLLCLPARRLERIDTDPPHARALRIRGELEGLRYRKEVDWSDRPVTRQGYFFDAKDVDPAFEFEPIRSASAFRANRYDLIHPERAAQHPEAFEGEDALFVLTSGGLAPLPSREARLLGLDPEKWRILRHNAAAGLPRLYVPESALRFGLPEDGLPGGIRLFVYGRGARTIEHDRIASALIVDALASAPTAIPGEAEEALAVTPAALRESPALYTHRRLVLPFVYRDHRPLPPGTFGEDAALGHVRLAALTTNETDLAGFATVLLPDAEGPPGRTIARAEPGDTLLLNGRFEREDDGYRFVIDAIERAPLLRPVPPEDAE